MDESFVVYTAVWLHLLVAALIFLYLHRNSMSIAHRDYWLFLKKPWKLVTFFTAAVTLTIAAPYTGDPTWDYVDAGFMSVLTYITAPWAVGVIYKSIRRELPWVQLYVALCLWMFSASWSYDLYIWLRDGSYPLTWDSNILASSVLYLAAGLMWNLDWISGRGVTFSFMEPRWPYINDSLVFHKILLFSSPFMLIVGGMLSYFLFW